MDEEIQEFMAEVADCAPVSAAQWLCRYLPTIETIYAFQVLTPAIMEGQNSIIQAVMQTVRENAGGIIQADGEGFTNEEGFHILWRFSDSVSGDWWMAVLENGVSQEFEMDLGDPDHRSAFKSGKVPIGVKRQ